MLPEIEELATVVACEDDDPTRGLRCDHLTADRHRALPAPSASDPLRLCGYNHPDRIERLRTAICQWQAPGRAASRPAGVAT